MKGHGEKLTRKEEQAIAALLTHPTINAAAKAIKVSEATLWRWLQLPAFQRRYRAARAASVAHAIMRLQQVSARAVDTLEAVLDQRGHLNRNLRFQA
jgi:hypothetical protein